MGDQTYADTQSPPPFKRQRTHSMTDGFQEALGRPNWSAHDRGNSGSMETHGLPVLMEQESSVNGNRRTSFGEMNLGGSLITGLNEETLKAYVTTSHMLYSTLNLSQLLQHHPSDASCPTPQRVTTEPSHQLSSETARSVFPGSRVLHPVFCFQGLAAPHYHAESAAATMLHFCRCG